MTTKRMRLWLAALVAFALVAAACGSDNSGSEEPAVTAADESAANEEDSLAGLAACPEPIVFQTDWFPEPEHGALYNLTAGEGSIDPDSGVFSGPLAADPSHTIEIRAGGPYIGFQPTVSLMATDPSIFLGYVNTDEAIHLYDTLPTVSVVTPLEVNPQIIMWDPATYTINEWPDVKDTGAVVNHFAGAFWTEFVVGAGYVDASQLDGSYDGSPTRFIAEEGRLIQQGFATQEPYNYEHVFTDWGKPVEFLLIHDGGFEIYQGALAIDATRLDDAADECLTALVPLIQQSAVDFQNNPGPTNAAILQAVIDLNSFWQLSEDSVANTVRMMDELGIVANGANSTLGDFDFDRLAGVWQVIQDTVPTITIPDGVTPETLYTNKYIDPSIGR